MKMVLWIPMIFVWFPQLDKAIRLKHLAFLWTSSNFQSELLNSIVGDMLIFTDINTKASKTLLANILYIGYLF